MGQTNSNRAVDNQDSIVSQTYVSGSNRVEDTTTTIKGLSNLTRATTAGYDGYNRLSSVATTPSLATIGYSYYSSGHASEGKLSGVTNDSPPPLATYTYAATGVVSSVSLENGLTSTWTRDAAGQATAFLTTDASSNVVSGVSHGYDNASRRTWAAYEKDRCGKLGEKIIAQAAVWRPQRAMTRLSCSWRDEVEILRRSRNFRHQGHLALDYQSVRAKKFS